MDLHLRGEVVEELAIGTELEDEEDVCGRLEHVYQVDDVFVSLDQTEDVHLPQRLVPQVQSVLVHNVVGHVDDFHGEVFPCLLLRVDHGQK